MKLYRILIIAALLVMPAAMVPAETWTDRQVACPVCGTIGTFKTPASYGSNVYMKETNIQLLFWPHTDNYSFYSCKHCGFTSFMSDYTDFDSTYKQKVADLLKSEKIKADFVNYYDYPIVKRLDLAEKCYKAMDKDDYFWCQFYRLKGYYLEQERDSAGARVNRTKALGLAEKMLKNEKFKPISKELMLIMSSMYYYIGKYDDAWAYGKRSKMYIYKGINMPQEDAARLNEVLLGFTEELLMRIEYVRKKGK